MNEKRNRGVRGAKPPAKIFIFEHFYGVLGAFEVRNRLLSTRSLRRSIFRAIRLLDLDFSIFQKSGDPDLFLNQNPDF